MKMRSTALINGTNERKFILFKICFSSVLLFVLILLGVLIKHDWIAVNPEERNLKPSLQYLFGTDWLGRDMFYRTLKGLIVSLQVGVIAALSSTLIALTLSLLSSWNDSLDRFIRWLIDLFLSIPHLVALLLIAFALGGGIKGVIIGIALTHWPTLTRLLRGEVKQLQQAEYVQISRQLGRSQLWIVFHHFIPFLLPQVIVGFILLFPHAILHEAAITFLGFGIPAELPAIGVILSESMQYLTTGMWWLAFFPGISLVFVVGLFDRLGSSIQKYFFPYEGKY